MIDNATVARILDAVRIEEVVSDYVSLRKRGVNLIGLCPFHDEKTGSFTVSPTKGIFKCFGCGEAGSAVHFIMKIEQKSYPEALKQLAKKYNIEVQEKELTAEEIAEQNDRESMFVVNEFAQKYYTEQMWNNPEGRSVGLSYFYERGFQDAIIKKFGLGYSLDAWDALAVAAKEKGYKREYLQKTGLCSVSDKGKVIDRFRGRVIFPIHTISGKVVAFGGRVLKPAEKVAKYINSPESEIYHKSNELYGIYLARTAIVKSNCCYLVEGYTDVISMHQAGIENVVASSGTALTIGQIHLIRRFTNNVTVLYDGDKAGIKATLRGVNLLLQEGMTVKVLLLPDGDDPDSFAQRHNADYFVDYIQKNQVDFIRFKANLLMDEWGNDPIKKIALVHDVVDSIALIPDSIARQVYVQSCANILQMEEKALLAEVVKARERNFKSKTHSQQNKQTEQPTPSEQTEQDVKTPTTPREVNHKDVDLKVIDEEIRHILRILLLFGTSQLFEDENEQKGYITVGEYVLSELRVDDIHFENPLYEYVVEEFVAHMGDEDFCPEKYFTFHQNGALSQLAVNLITDRYRLSKIHLKKKVSENSEVVELPPPTDADRLNVLVPRLIYEFKSSLLKQRTKQVLLEIKEAEAAGDMNTLFEKMALQKALVDTQRELSLHLGQRVVVKL